VIEAGGALLPLDGRNVVTVGVVMMACGVVLAVVAGLILWRVLTPPRNAGQMTGQR